MEVFVKYRILKMAVIIGLVSSSSLAVAEGRFAYKQPLQGVDASPTFGMTVSERQSMCLTQEITTKQVEKTRTAYKTELRQIDGVEMYDVSLREDGRAVDGGDYYFFRRGGPGHDTIRYKDECNLDFYHQGEEILEWCGKKFKFGEVRHNFTNHISTSGGIAYLHPIYLISEQEVEVPYEETYTADVDIKSENYDWCVANGYQTAN